MSDQRPTFDIPFKSDIHPEVLGPQDQIQFRCYKGISCFNACCRHADVTLAPYDIIRLKRRLGIGSTEFLERYTVPFQLDPHVPGVKLKTDEAGACRLLTEEGCSVYGDHPTACRYYPVGLMAMRAKDSPTDEHHYFLIREEHCKGHDEDRALTIADYRKEQGVEEYDDLNREWYRIMLKKRSSGPTVGRPSETSLQLFFMVSYDIDRFRRFVLSDSFRKTYDLDEDFFAQVEGDDVALMTFGFRLLRQVLYGEQSIPERPGALEQRLEERKEVIEARREAEILKHQEDQDKIHRDAVDD